MKTLGNLAAGTFLLTLATAALADHHEPPGGPYPGPGPGLEAEFDGSFDEASSTGPECDGIFSARDYHARHALAGPTLRTSVLKLTSTDRGSFFADVAFVGLLGGSDDLYYEKTLTRDGRAYDVVAEGVIDRSVLYLDFTVTAKGARGEPLCKATATYSGFN